MEVTKKNIAFLPFFLVATLSSCAGQQPAVYHGENPVEEYEHAKIDAATDRGVDFSLDRKKFEAAMYLYEHAQTDLKAGNSAKAIGELALAREYNPWHDDIKDLYVLAVGHFVKITKKASGTDCSIVNNRLSFLSQTAPDYLDQLKDQIDRCKFKPKEHDAKITQKYIEDIKVPDNALGAVGSVDFDLLGELNGIVSRNAHNPTPELLALALDYLSKIEIDLGNPHISPLSTDLNKFEITVPIKFTNRDGMSGEEFCESTRSFLELKEGTDRISCRYWKFWSLQRDGHGDVEYSVNPSFFKIPEAVWPLPKKVVIAFRLKYKMKPERVVRDVIYTGFKPENVDPESGFYFDYVSGDLVLKQGQEYTSGQHEHWTIERENASIVIESDRTLIDGLIGISAYIDLKATRDLYL